jgi:hypothetical protein
MLSVRDMRRVAWRRRYARRHYLGYATVLDGSLRLGGREIASGIDVALSIPESAIRAIRLGASPEEEVVGKPTVVIEFLDDDPIYLRPIEGGPFELGAFARRLQGMTPLAAAAS